ncbi:family 43 glycosylhydrolase [Devosia sp. BK]|uniref:family 43 glycosylhydrolase n=1 Tax=Devosia sp. BK TaxID=2871706 RepID=UPI00293A487B|nr:family 43 glycosylhydrolase [Devosia sp. BK]MDV3251027.1 family 43 glycosylhydrolase [Devosia sp. BK]
MPNWIGGLAVTWFLAGAISASAQDAPAPLGDTGIYSADPSVIHTDDGFVAVESRRGDSLVVRVASSLDALAEARGLRIWFDRDRLGEVWAPEIVYKEGLYHVYFAAGVGEAHRMYRITSTEPTSGYGPAEEIDLPEDKWAIDGMPFSFDGDDFFVWSGWQGDSDVQQDIFIVKLQGDDAPDASRAIISSPDQPWENVANETPSINEGPQPIVDPAGQLHVVYSANGSWGANYCLADLRLRADGVPLVAEDWSKSDGCLFGANAETLSDTGTLATAAKGVGHHSFITDEDGTDGEGVKEPVPFLYHGVPEDEEPSNFWSARKWFFGQYQWVPDVEYRSPSGADRGWSLHFSE